MSSRSTSEIVHDQRIDVDHFVAWLAAGLPGWIDDQPAVKRISQPKPSRSQADPALLAMIADQLVDQEPRS